MPIREKGYHSWEGDLIEGHKSWKTIAQHGIRQVFRKKFSKIVLFASIVTFLVFLVLVYLAAKPELKVLTDAAGLKTDASMVNLYLTTIPFNIMLFLLVLFAGAGQISQDIKFKSFTLYFSRPVLKADYIKGKLSSVLFYYLAFTMVPVLILLLEKMLISGNFTVQPRAVLGAVVFPLVVGTLFSSFVLMISSITGNTKMVYIMVVIIYLIPEIMAGTFRSVFNSDYFLYLSAWRNIKNFGSWIFGLEPAYNIPLWISGVVLLAVIAAANAFIYFRLNKVEV